MESENLKPISRAEIDVLSRQMNQFGTGLKGDILKWATTVADENFHATQFVDICGDQWERKSILRAFYTLHERGLLTYVDHDGDQRIKMVRLSNRAVQIHNFLNKILIDNGNRPEGAGNG
jgi:hypothetical protein